MMNTVRLRIAVEQVELAAKDSKMTPLELVAGWDKGSPGQREIYKAIAEKHPPQEKTDGTS